MGNSGHPGLRWVEELSLISSAGIWDSRFGAFLYSNAAVVAGLRSAARLARLLDREEPAARWDERADRIWRVGILSESASDGGNAGPGLVDHATGRFLEGRRLSTLRGWWTDQPDKLLGRSQALDISMLGVVVPFDLLPAGDPRARATAEAIFKQNAIAGDANFFARWSPDGAVSDRKALPSEGHAHDSSSLATLWMARYLIKLGRETGEGRIWNLALSILDALIARLGPLGLSLRAGPRGGDQGRPGLGSTSGVWGLQSMLIEAMLDLAGLDYDAPDRRLDLDPTLPGAWPHIGLTHKYPCGEASYRLERPIGGTVHRLTFQARLDHRSRWPSASPAPAWSASAPGRPTPRRRPRPTSRPRAGSNGRSICPKGSRRGPGRGGEPPRSPPPQESRISERFKSLWPAGRSDTVQEVTTRRRSPWMRTFVAGSSRGSSARSCRSRGSRPTASGSRCSRRRST